MKKYFWILVSLICCTWTLVSATYEDFSNQLKSMDIDTRIIESQASISRYDLARLLSTTECKDCINPNQDMIKKYVQNFRSTFTATPGKDFSDISYLWGIKNNISYYYCVAYVGENTYMRWYPKATSPICGWQFCWSKNTTTAEFIQVVINMIAQYIYKDLSLNRKEVNTWIGWLKQDSYEANNFTQADRKTITETSKSCEKDCILKDASEVNLYLKYCMFNIGKCDMQEVGKIKQGYRPVAELNLLYKQNIIDIGQNQRKNIDKDIDGRTVIETLYKLNGKINCSFNNNYDCDGVENTKDNCPNSFNPSQKDTDKDGIGDVCDDDIDGDGIKNPIGIVDEEGKVDISKRTKNMDNCLFIQNTNQRDDSNNSVGNACEEVWNKNQIGLYISIDKIVGSAPSTVSFKAISTGSIGDIIRNFWDGTQGKGESITHTFISPNMYNVEASAQGNNNIANAQVIVVVGKQASDDKVIQPRANIVWGKTASEITLSASIQGSFDTFERIFPKENITIKKTANENFKRIFIYSWENPVIVKWYSNWTLVGIGLFTIGIENGKGSILKSNTMSSEINNKILFDTQTYNVTQDDIVDIEWNFGDETIIRNTSLTMEYTYNKPWKRVITQTINLIDGNILTNIITIIITDKTLQWSYALLMTPSKLIADIGENIYFSASIIGNFLKTPITQIAEFWDGLTEQKPGIETMPSVFIHTYQHDGIMNPKDSMYINQCTYLENKATISIRGKDICLSAKTQGTLGTYRCDLDGDGIPDICDTDIDNDGKPNLLWLINSENKDCSFESDSTKLDANLNEGILSNHYEDICALDNAPFTYNPDQLDLNQDGIGDLQAITLAIQKWDKDTDGDGIPDYKDLCPTIQETWNGITDNDWCPEIGLDLWCQQQRITPLVGIINENIIINPIETIITLATCGNTTIDPWENCNNCPQDVGICISWLCGNGVINQSETCSTCPQDVGMCGKYGTGISSGPLCGNKIINTGETCATCPQDIGICWGSGVSGGPFCGNGIIDKSEVCSTCPQDVGICVTHCGNGKIEAWENCVNCPEDVKSCWICGDGIKDWSEDCITCPEDYGICKEKINCGNRLINEWEDCLTCPLDIGMCWSFGATVRGGPLCRNSKIDVGETCATCPQDIGICEWPAALTGEQLCGNWLTNKWETCTTCPQDIGICWSFGVGTPWGPLCGNSKIDAGETCSICPQDIGICIWPSIWMAGGSLCGNGIINQGETCINCTQDVRRCLLPWERCGNQQIDIGETCITCPQDIGICWGSDSMLLCGNGIINAGETCTTCPQDIGICWGFGAGTPVGPLCGNSKIDANETCATCPQDIGVCEGPSPLSGEQLCGNGAKNPWETCTTCPQDIGICWGSGANISGTVIWGPFCGNKIINAGETCATCPQDIGICWEIWIGTPWSPLCGNNKIDAGETCATCPQDIGICWGIWNMLCGNKTINPWETCTTCPQDIGDCWSPGGLLCGNGTPNPWETCSNCKQDIGVCWGTGVNASGTVIWGPFCGNKIINAGETCATCPQDIGICGWSGTNDSGTIWGLLCGNGAKNPWETCTTCPQDIKACTGPSPLSGEQLCGNGATNPWETCITCSQDIGNCWWSGTGTVGPLCGNGKIDTSETCTTCPKDLWTLCVIMPEVGTCNQCPCQFADYSSDLANNDQVRAILRDTKKTIQYRFSAPRIVEFK